MGGRGGKYLLLLLALIFSTCHTGRTGYSTHYYSNRVEWVPLAQPAFQGVGSADGPEQQQKL